MRAWRICKGKYAATALSGEGARRYGSRWNHKGTALVYVSESLALAALEFFVHIDPQVPPPRHLVAIRVNIPRAVSLETLDRQLLPKDWRRLDPPSSTQALGTRWLQGLTACALLVPSVLIPQEHNILLNPLHADFRHVTVESAEAFDYDPRMWKHVTP